jgi:four helix bundle protein
VERLVHGLARERKAEGKMQNEEKDLKLRTFTYAPRIIKLYSALPKTTVAQVLGKQVLRSGTSVGANYREASRGRSKAEFIAKAGDCLREIEESNYWIALIEAENLLPPAKLSALRDETNQLTAIFVTILNRSKQS